MSTFVNNLLGLVDDFWATLDEEDFAFIKANYNGEQPFEQFKAIFDLLDNYVMDNEWKYPFLTTTNGNIENNLSLIKTSLYFKLEDYLAKV